MGFGESVTALLETYSNCLSLLKAFKRRAGDADDRRSDQQSLLRKSLKADRNRVSRAYSSRLSESGSRLQKGDGRFTTTLGNGGETDTYMCFAAKAKSALSRVLKKLRAAIANLMRIASKNQKPVLDYNSLMSLSNASRVDAIRAIDQLSHRLGSTPSRRSLASSSASSSASRHKRQKSSSTTSTSSQHAEVGPSRKDSRVKKEQDTARRKVHSHKSKEDMAKDERRSSSQTHGASTRAHGHSHGRSDSGSSGGAVHHRVSLISVSTDSTKLGEIPERKWRPRLEYYDNSSDASSEYNVRPTYPLKPYKAEVKERRFWGLFRRG